MPVGSSFARLRCLGFYTVNDPFPTGEEGEVMGFASNRMLALGG